MHETVMEAVWRADGNVTKAARSLGWCEREVRQIFDDNAACVRRGKKLHDSRKWIGNKEVAHLSWQSIRGAMVGFEEWKSVEDFWREEER